LNEKMALLMIVGRKSQVMLHFVAEPGERNGDSSDAKKDPSS
jgi:hypothetical protein